MKPGIQWLDLLTADTSKILVMEIESYQHSKEQITTNMQ